jgi:hypothetical protein
MSAPINDALLAMKLPATPAAAAAPAKVVLK